MHNALFGLNVNEYRAPRLLTNVYAYPGYCASLTEVTEVPGKGMGILHNLQKFPVRVRKCYRTRRSSGYSGTGVQNSKFRAGIKMLYPYPGYLWHGRTELTEVPGTGMNVLQNLQKFFVG